MTGRASLFHSLLGRWGCIVETARDGREGLIMARLSTYDAVLVDIRLPDMNGYRILLSGATGSAAGPRHPDDGVRL